MDSHFYLSIITFILTTFTSIGVKSQIQDKLSPFSPDFVAQQRSWENIVIDRSPFTPPPDNSADRDFREGPPPAQPTHQKQPSSSQQGQWSQGRPAADQKSSEGVGNGQADQQSRSLPERVKTHASWRQDSADNSVQIGSPFKPPTSSEWRDGKMQPAASPPENKAPEPTRRHRQNRPVKKPRVTVYQEGRQTVRDMHDSAPGVTPWTRYTPRPRVRGQENGGSQRGNRARCGNRTYLPRSEICCQGEASRRQGLKPSCCGRQAYDSTFSKCCNGVVSLRTSQEPECTS